MKKFILLAAMLCSSVYAAFPLIKVDDISGSFSDRTGSAYAEYVSYDLNVVKINHKKIEVEFNQKEKNLVLNDLNTSVELNFDFSFLNVFKSLSFSNVDIRSNPKLFTSSLEELSLFIDPREYALKNVEIGSDLTNVARDINDISILEGFILNGDIAVKSISFGPISPESLREDIVAENPALEKEANEFLSKAEAAMGQGMIPVMGRNFRMVIKEKTFSGSVLLDSWINVWLYLGGKIESDEKKQKLYIDLYKAKLGIFSVKGLALKAVRALKLETVQVDGNRITVDLGKVLASGRDGSI